MRIEYYRVSSNSAPLGNSLEESLHNCRVSSCPLHVPDFLISFHATFASELWVLALAIGLEDGFVT